MGTKKMGTKRLNRGKVLDLVHAAQHLVFSAPGSDPRIPDDYAVVWSSDLDRVKEVLEAIDVGHDCL